MTPPKKLSAPKAQTVKLNLKPSKNAERATPQERAKERATKLRARMAALIAEFIPADKLTDFHARVNGLAGVGVGEAAIEAAVNPPKPAAGVNEATEASGDALET